MTQQIPTADRCTLILATGESDAYVGIFLIHKRVCYQQKAPSERCQGESAIKLDGMAGHMGIAERQRTGSALSLLTCNIDLE